MGTLYFVRHGETVWNVENKICGSTDVDLTELGQAQAIEAGKMIAKEKITADEIIHSPLIRARDTALAISRETKIPAREEQRLREQHFGRWESTPRDSDEFNKAKENFVYSFDGGESMLRVAQRIYNLLDEITAPNQDKTYIIVAHNGISRIVQSYFNDMTNEDFANWGIGNCQVVKYQW